MDITNQYELEQEAKQIAIMAKREQKEYGMWPIDYIHEQCDGHQCVIYTYKAGLLCLECDRDDGEQYLEDIEYQATSYQNHVTKLAYAILFSECLAQLVELEDA